MDNREKAFQKKLLATFSGEAAEHIRTLSSGLVQLESSPDAQERERVIETVFRGVHSLKGAARAVGQSAMEAICQSAESVLSELKQKKLALSPSLFDVLHDAADALGRLLSAIGQEPGGDAAPPDSLLKRLDSAGTGQTAPQAAPRRAAPAEKPPPVDTVRIATDRLDRLLRQAEELLSLKTAAAQHVTDLRQAVAQVRGMNKERAKAAPAAYAALAKSLEARLEALSRSAEHDRRSLFMMVDGLLEDMKKALMLPASSALEGFPKMVRDLSRDQGKEVDLAIRGAELEIDRRILEEMRDPLLHLIRNCIDHGIEMSEARREAGKPPRGTVSLAVAQMNGSKVEILVADDGAGIDASRVRDAARKLGLVSLEGAGSGDQEILPLVFRSGISTSPIITDLSGRGLGLAIVWEKVERLGGSVAVESQPGRGTCFRIILPLTLATFRGVHVRVGEHRFVVPGVNVEQCVRLKREAVQTVENRETIPWNGQAVALVRLADALELPRGAGAVSASDAVLAIVLTAAGKRVAFRVDEVLGEQEVLVKSLGRQLARVRNIAGATVLGTGKAVPILNIADLVQSAARVASAPEVGAPAKRAVAAPAPSVLVAEDSITSRALLKNILESAGYRVAAAVDGIEALTLLKTERFDLVVSDVEMPRMDGFDLTARIRADAALASLPVVLVTGLESREHRERGAEAGASAYVVKSSFDQGNLLDIVRRLL